MSSAYDRYFVPVYPPSMTKIHNQKLTPPLYPPPPPSIYPLSPPHPQVSSIMGTEGDATPFIELLTVDSISTVLKECGYQKHGNECLYNGHTGRPLQSLIFLGPTFYQRLKHLVDDKIHARARGPVTMLTRQPMEGRAREGGLRMGEMERDCLISHGAANFLRDRLYSNSDPYRVHVCDECGACVTPPPALLNSTIPSLNAHITNSPPRLPFIPPPPPLPPQHIRHDRHRQPSETDLRLPLLRQQDQFQPGAHTLRRQATFPGTHEYVYLATHLRGPQRRGRLRRPAVRVRG